MKTYIFKFIIYFVATIFCQSCDLSLQKDYDYESSVPDPHINMTAWEYLSSEKDRFSLFTEAIEHAGIKEYYEQTKSEYTYLALSNTAMNTLLSERFAGNDIQDCDKEILKKYLLYHIIINGKFTTIGDLSSEPFFVQTALKGEEGFMTLCFYKNAYPTGVAKVIVNETGSNGSSPRRLSITTNIMPVNGVIHVFDTYCYYNR